MPKKRHEWVTVLLWAVFIGLVAAGLLEGIGEIKRAEQERTRLEQERTRLEQEQEQEQKRLAQAKADEEKKQAEAAVRMVETRKALANASIAKPFVNSLGMKFVPVPGTKVIFCIHETRNVDYSAYANENRGVDEVWLRAWDKGEDQHPVVYVSWEDANAFCQWLSAKEGIAYRLPTDTEWSVAVGGLEAQDPAASPKSKSGKIEVYPWGGSYPPRAQDGNYGGRVDGYAGTAPIMQFRVNRFGLYDMGGNVVEWCVDEYSTEYDLRLLPEYRVLRVRRGGSWRWDMRVFMLSSHRDPRRPVERYDYGGFRCVVVVAGG